MKTNDDKILIKSYLNLLRGLSDNSKLAIISKLSSGVKKNRRKKKRLLKISNESFVPEKSAEEIIKDIKMRIG